jgi:hypothetical protein
MMMELSSLTTGVGGGGVGGMLSVGGGSGATSPSRIVCKGIGWLPFCWEVHPGCQQWWW